jgi:hypothetical protein
MKIDDLLQSLPSTENELLERYDETAEKRFELSKEIDALSRRLGDNFSVVLKQRQIEYSPLRDELIAQSTANDELIDEYYELSNVMIAIENKLRKISKEN